MPDPIPNSKQTQLRVAGIHMKTDPIIKKVEKYQLFKSIKTLYQSQRNIQTLYTYTLAGVRLMLELLEHEPPISCFQSTGVTTSVTQF